MLIRSEKHCSLCRVYGYFEYGSVVMACLVQENLSSVIIKIKMG